MKPVAKTAVCMCVCVCVFARRQRATESGKSPYVVLFDSFNLRPMGATFQLHNIVSDIVFRAELFPLQDNTIRLKINEASPLVLRYEAPVGDVLVGEPQTQRLVIAFFKQVAFLPLLACIGWFGIVVTALITSTKLR